MERRPTELIISFVAFALLAAMSKVAGMDQPPSWEINSFRYINGLPGWLFPIIWPFMQYGVFATIPAVSAIAFYYRRYRLATLLLLGGLGIYYLALFVKDLVPRGRPDALLDGIMAREQFKQGSSGFTSGHTAVASTIATFAHYYLSKKWQIISIFTLTIVAFGRIYIGGHMPLDVLGGICLGVGVASLLNYIAGVPVTIKPRVEETKTWISQHRPRHPGDVIRLVIAAIVFGITTLLAFTGQVGGIEESLFRLVNSFPSFLSPVLQTLMQAGALYFIFIASAFAYLFKHKRLSIKILFGGVTVWWLAKIAKLLVDRDRPFYILSEITQRAQNSGILGFPSGHAAVAALIATVCSPYISRGWSRLFWGVAVTVALSRMYVGAHLPLDIIAGLSLGWFVGSSLNIAFGTPQKSIPYDAIKTTLKDAGMSLANLNDAEVDARGSSPLFAKTNKGRNVFIKLIDKEQRNADILYRLWRHITMREVEDEAPFASSKQSIEHEAYLSIQAEKADVRVPAVLLAAPVNNQAAILVTQKINGKTLNRYKGRLDETLLGRLWGQVIKLHEKRIAHRDLRTANIIIDKERQPWLIDFSFAKTAASDTQLRKDIVELTTSLAILTSPAMAVRSAIKALGEDRVKSIQPYLQPLALTTTTRKQLKNNPSLIAEILAAIQQQTGSHPVKPIHMSRIRYRWLVFLALMYGAMYYLLPKIGELDGIVEVVPNADIKWLLATAGASLATYLAASLVILGSTRKVLSFWLTFVVQLATTFVNRITPKSVGGITLIQRYLEKSEHTRMQAAAVVTLVYGVGVIVHSLLLGIVLLIIDTKNYSLVDISKGQIVLISVVILLLGFGLLFIPWIAKHISGWINEVAKGMRDILTTPVKFMQLVGGSIGVTMTYTFALYCSLEAFGSSLPFATLLFIYLAGSAVASASPTPGGLGATEAALVLGLTAFGVHITHAVAGVLLFRLFTFWLPILPGVYSFRYLIKNKLI